MVPWPEPLRLLFERVARETELDPDILHAIAWQETNVNPNAPAGRDGEIGIMQVRPGTAPGRPGNLSFTPAELGSLEGNVRAAAKLWKAHEPIIGTSVVLGFDAYNGGIAKGRVRVGAGNDRYVFEATARYLALKWSQLAPSRILS